MSSCGAETHLLFSGHSAIDASDTSARAAPGAHVGQPAPKAASKVSHEARRSSEECVGSARDRTVPITNRHDSPWFESFRSHFALFWSFWLAISEPGWISRKKVPLGIRLKSTRPSHEAGLAESTPTGSRQKLCGAWMNELKHRPAYTVTELASDRQHQLLTGRPSWGAR